MTTTPTSAPPPIPQPDATTQFFWDAVAKHELWIQRCQNCKHYVHYPKILCRFCQSDDLQGEPVSGRGTLYSWTIAVQPFLPFYVDRIPYTIGTVELEEQPGLMFTTQIVECAEEDLRMGMPLEVVFVELHPDLTLPFFRPAGDDAGGA